MKENIAVRSEFDSLYTFTVVERFSESTEKRLLFPGAGEVYEADGLHVEIETGAGKWGAVFVGGDYSPNAHSGVYTSPAENIICCAAKGSLFFVNVLNPREWNEEEDLIPVMGILPAINFRCLIIFDYIRVYAHNGHEFVWGTPSLSYDGLFNVKLVGSKVIGEGWSAPDKMNKPFEIDIESGAFSGGVGLEN